MVAPEAGTKLDENHQWTHRKSCCFRVKSFRNASSKRHTFPRGLLKQVAEYQILTVNLVISKSQLKFAVFTDKYRQTAPKT